MKYFLLGCAVPILLVGAIWLYAFGRYFGFWGRRK